MTEYAFQAEINQLLSLIINTFYSNKDVFLRELISNASDAIDKVRYTSLTNKEILGQDTELEIKIISDKENNTLTIWDNGVGMSKEELVKNLGTIAHSGTKAFMEALQAGQKPDISLIGQFGVGFYSAYLVAKQVTVISKNYEQESAFVWESNASGSFTVKQASDEQQITRGTKLILTLKEDMQEYLEEQRLKDIIIKHSEYCSFPIQLQVEKEDIKQFDLVNKNQPIWLRKPEEVTQDEYNSFYKNFTNDWDEHLAAKHFSVDGQVQFKGLLYIPKRAPHDMFVGSTVRNNIKLYVKKVLIMEETNDLLPEYLSFVRGVVDSDDLPLNVSREMLQQNGVMKLIKRALVKKVIEMMQDLSTHEDTSKWNTFYDNFNTNIKLGAHQDLKNKNKLVDLLRFKSTKSEESPVGFKEYVEQMKETQTKIYYVTGESLKSVRTSPCLEQLKKKGFEVLYMVDPIDEYMVQSLHEYDNTELVCCSKDGFELEQTEDEKKAQAELETEWKETCDKIKETLGNRVTGVKISSRLSENPCVLVTDKYGWTANMERIMRAQALQTSGNFMAGSRKILEINPEHNIIKNIKERLANQPAEKSNNVINMLYDTTLLDSGFTLEEPSSYAQRIYRLIGMGLEGEDTVTDAEIEVHQCVNSLEEVD